MARFFKSPEDLVVWLKKNCSNAPEASSKMITLTGSRDKEQDIVESVRRIFENEDTAGASTVLFDILSEYEITEAKVASVNNNMHKVVAADALLKAKEINADTHKKMIKEAQVMRQGGEYQAMPLRVCPKLPKQSAGQQLISTYNCRHYCLDSLVFDDEPMRVYCAETLWRKHVMDKFSREWKDENGEWVGGYINNRFYKFPKAGTPDNPDVERTQGNRMQLAPGERTRQPKPHEFSMERRLSEQREKGSTKSITVLPSKTASIKTAQISIDDDRSSGVQHKNGYITKVWDGVEYEIEWAATLYEGDSRQPDEVELDLPEELLEINNSETNENHPFEDECDKWKSEILDACYGVSRDPSVDVMSSAKTILLVQAENKGFVKLASANQNKNSSEEEIVGIFGRLVDLRNSGLDAESAAAKVVKETGCGVEKVVKIQSIALRKMKIHQADVYSIIMGKKSEVVKPQVKTAQLNEVLLQTPPDADLPAQSPTGQVNLEPETILLERGDNSYEVYDPDSMQGTGIIVSLVNPGDKAFLRDFNEVLNGFKETGEG